jgi:predicted RNA-binding protein with PUA-like domain
MAFFLLKTEPSSYSFADLEREKRTMWNGITNPAALKHLKSAKPGDAIVFYHTGDERQAVGLGEVVSAPYPDPKDKTLTVVDVAPRTRLKKPVPLATLKADKRFAESPLVRQGRLSFVPLTETEYGRILRLGS